MLSTAFSALFIIYLRASSPATLHISCGSAITVVVPHGVTASENSEGERWLDSIWQWLSIRPGTRYSPFASISSIASLFPSNPIIYPSLTYTLALNVV